MSNTPVSPTKPKSQTYDGQCHCGKIKFTVKLSPPIEDGPVTNCNCSICHTNGYLMVYPLDSNIDWISGFDEMTTYSFGKERIHHTFCPTCGTSIGGKSSDPNFFADNRALNVRTLKKVNIDDLKLRKVDSSAA
ncbi:Mss4-like protein [Exophiala viscosa]|uniref:Mss4-like protein n=1 Tax=Exophiala viscosa TaxID=2486360 RepID=A0AAN6DYC5_9EURO|nr:Mss4-like protein [Exophiala viscosa]KAI1624210.1 Mss4-like protein [Exophiala viscosa]